MKILLLNNNPVVNKLVTLSAQKTSDELEVVENTDVINAGAYDLVVVDDTLYRDTLFGVLREKITFKKSLYICSRDAASAEEFSKMIKKPFLPTDLVELFSSIGKEVKEEKISETPDVNSLDAIDSIEEIGLDDFGLEEINLDDGEEISLDMEDEISLDDELFSDGDLSDDLSDAILDLDDLSDESSKSVLDKDDLQEVQDLLDLNDTEEKSELSGFEELSLENDINLEKELEEDDDLESLLDEITLDTPADEEDIVETKESSLDNEINLDSKEDDLDLAFNLDSMLDEISDVPDISEELSSPIDDTENLQNVLEEPIEDDEINLDDMDSILDEVEETTVKNEVNEIKEESVEDSMEDEFNFEEELQVDEALDSFEDEDTLVAKTANIELEIEQAVNDLTQEELESELDEESLLDMVSSDISGLDDLNSRDLKIAFGEEVPALEEVIEEEINEVPALTTNNTSDSKEDEIPEVLDLDIQEDSEGVQSLKKLLAALSDKNVAASMKGMKISINIELGDN